ncbi:MAG TPA: hypothetical protein VGM94_02700 [Galbitalea sp.]|jgi:uncharacterized protein YcfL
MKATLALVAIALLLTGCSSGPSQAEKNCVTRIVNDVFADGTVTRTDHAVAEATVDASKSCAAAEKKDPEAFQQLYG